MLSLPAPSFLPTLPPRNPLPGDEYWAVPGYTGPAVVTSEGWSRPAKIIGFVLYRRHFPEGSGHKKYHLIEYRRA